MYKAHENGMGYRGYLMFLYSEITRTHPVYATLTENFR